MRSKALARRPFPRWIVLALLALAAAGFALWTAWQLRTAGAARSEEVDRLRAELDSLRVQVRQFNDPFGPTAGPTAGPAVRDTLTAPLPQRAPRR